MRFFYLLLLLTGSAEISAQDVQLKGDCRDAVEIAPKGNHKFNSFPTGFGESLEISGNPSNSTMYFEKEQNTA